MPHTRRRNDYSAISQLKHMWSAAKSWAVNPTILVTKIILARLAAILAILLFFSARGTKINRVEKTNNEKNIIFEMFSSCSTVFQMLKFQISFKILKELVNSMSLKRALQNSSGGSSKLYTIC